MPIHCETRFCRVSSRLSAHACCLFTALFVVLFAALLAAPSAAAGQQCTALRTDNGHYLTAVNGGGFGGPDFGPAAVPLHDDTDHRGPWEWFTPVWVDKAAQRVALRTADGHYLTAVNGGGIGGPDSAASPFHTTATEAGPDELFRLSDAKGDRVLLETRRGLSITAVRGGGMGESTSQAVRTDAVSIGPNEIFTLVGGTCPAYEPARQDGPEETSPENTPHDNTPQDQDDKQYGTKPRLSAEAAALLHSGNSRIKVTFGASLTGDYFQNLFWNDSASGPVFTRAPKPGQPAAQVDSFPDQLVLDATLVDAMSFCAGPLGRELIGPYHYSAHWERDGHKMPSQDFTQTASTFPFRPWRECSVDPARDRLTLSGKGMRLTDTLVIEVHVDS